MNTSALNTQPPHKRQAIKIQEDQQQDLEEEIDAIFKDELMHLC
jgi:hypothetical protein